MDIFKDNSVKVSYDEKTSKFEFDLTKQSVRTRDKCKRFIYIYYYVCKEID